MTFLLEILEGLLQISFDLGYLIYSTFDKQADKEKAMTGRRFLLNLLGVFTMGLIMFTILILGFLIM